MASITTSSLATLAHSAALSTALFGTNIDHFCNTVNHTIKELHAEGLSNVFVTGSEVQRWGMGVVQEIDAAAMHVFARWQHQEADVELDGVQRQYRFALLRLTTAHLQQEACRSELRGLGSVPGWRHHLLLSQNPERISIGSRPLRGGFFLFFYEPLGLQLHWTLRGIPGSPRGHSNAARSHLPSEAAAS